jgi:hypothetical protein
LSSFFFYPRLPAPLRAAALASLSPWANLMTRLRRSECREPRD